MAYQHFYSRVPHRMSMFKRTDGYDTFAVSEGVSREYIDKELSAVCDYKPTKYENMLILEDKLPPVYCKYSSSKGDDMILSCISYIPRDYTNERSSFMVHSLILTGEEKQKAISRIGYKILNPNMFETSLSRFNVTSQKSAPIENYPELDYQSEKTGALKVLTEKYTPRVLKRFIYALLASACGKGKPIYVTLGGNATEVSENALELMNLILQIFPFNVRENISYITYLSDYTKFNTFKVKFLPPDCMAIPTGKGYTFDNMSPRLADGIRDEEYLANEVMVEFFFHLIADAPMRTAFLKFCDNATEKDPSLAVPTLKTVSALVFLFRQSSKLFSEKEVLPDDNKVYELFCIYEKYRDALLPSERSAVLSCLGRYPRLHVAIPQNIFTKFCKLYPHEPPKAQNTAMEIILELFHTDLMREKLFAFIKANYASESPKNRAVICHDLCSVFYGGFLQPQILALFAQYFPTEEESTRDAIVDKLLLVIRTASIREKTIEFFKNYYSQFTPNQKRKFLATVYEMLPFGDQLSDELLQLLDKVMLDEKEEIKTDVAVKINEAVASNQRKKEPALLGMVLNREGFCKNVVVRNIVTEQNTRKIFDEYLSSLVQKGFLSLANELVNLRKIVPYQDKHLETRIYDKLSAVVAEVAPKATLADVINADTVVNQQLVGKFNDQADEFGKKISKELLLPIISNRLYDVFNPRLFKDGVAFVTEYAQSHASIRECESFAVINAFKDVISAVNAGDAEKVANCYCVFPQNKTARANIALSLKKKIFPQEEELVSDQSKATAFATMTLLNGYLSKAIPSVSDTFADMLAICTGALSKKQEYIGKKEKNIQTDATALVLNAVLSAVAVVRKSSLPEELKNAFINEQEDVIGLKEMLSSANAKLANGLNRALKPILAELSQSDSIWMARVKASIPKTSLFSFFKKK